MWHSRLPWRSPCFALLLFVAGCSSSDSRTDVPTQRLRSLPYAGSVPVAATESAPDGVTHHADGASPGYTLYSPLKTHAAVLVGMDGELVHRWRREAGWQGSWQTIELNSRGGLVALERNESLICLEGDGRIGWQVDGQFHHDFDFTEDGWIVALTRADRRMHVQGVELPVLEDSITVIDPRGRLERVVPLGALLGKLVPRPTLVEAKERAVALETKARSSSRDSIFQDIFHTNSVHVLRRPIEGIAEVGDLLLSVREIDSLVIVDRTMRRVLWQWGPGVVERQHHATLQPNGTVLLFDNGTRRGRSRVLEVEPRSGKVVWEYEDGDRFFSMTRGGVQRLVNGNTLVAESDAGRLFEVTSDGDLVWEYFTPARRVKKTGERTRAAVYRAERVDESALELVNGSSAPGSSRCDLTQPS